MRLVFLIVLTVLVAGAGGELNAQASGSVRGRVISSVTGAPVPGASVEIVGIASTTSTDTAGVFIVAGIAVGVYELRFRAIGYQPFVRASVVIGSGKATEIRVPLTPIVFELEGVTVVPDYFEVPATSTGGAQTLTSTETRRAPGVQEDVVRAVALLPGVGVTTGGRNDLVVRGGAPYENLFLVDGVEVPNINHFGSQGSTGGPLSLINIEFVERTEFATGGLAAKYGNRTASVTDITLREGTNERVSGTLNLSATGFGALAEGPIGKSTTFWIGARRSYLDLVFKAADFSFIPSYWDLQFKTTTRLGAKNTLSLLGVGALGSVEFVNKTADDRYDNSRILAPEQQQYVAAAIWQHLFTGGVLSVTAGRTYVRYESFQNDSSTSPVPIFANTSTEGENGLRVDVVWEPFERVDLNIGNNLKFANALDYDITLDGAFRLDGDTVPQPLDVDTSFTAVTNATYLEIGHQLSRRVRWSLGGRVGYYGAFDVVTFDPRGSLRFTVSDRAALWTHVGLYHQAPSFVWLLGDPSNRATLDPIRADQFVVGGSIDVWDDVRVQAEVYYKDYRSYPSRTWRPQAVLAPSGFEDATADIPFGLEPLQSVGTGRSYGVELLVRKRLSRVPVFGLMSLALARTRFTSLEAEERIGQYDTPVIANFLLGWRPNAAWELSGKFRLSTGLPTTPFVQSGPATGQLDFSRYNEGPRLPTFHAVDIRVDKRWSFKGVQLVTYLDVQNVYGRKNVSGLRWDARTQAPEADESLGILPTIGINLTF